MPVKRKVTTREELDRLKIENPAYFVKIAFTPTDRTEELLLFLKPSPIPDALSRLLNESAINRGDADSEEGTLNEVFAPTVSLIELSDEFREGIQEAYQKDKQWMKVYKMLEKAEEVPKGTRFLLKDELIHY
ncbi:hypothetical protein MMC24_003412 [Lignoscripta atroalba]|nr:hypothetical protein [Lignoscripta atroalba]